MEKDMKQLLTVLFTLLLISGSLKSQQTNKFSESKKNLGKIDLTKLQQNSRNVNISELSKMAAIIKASSKSSGQTSPVNSLNFKTSPLSLEQLLLLKDMNKDIDGTSKITWNKRNGTPSFIQLSPSGNKLMKAQLNLEGRKTAAISFLSQYKNLLKLKNPADELNLIKTEIETNGLTHFKYQQCYKGIKVWGCFLFAHLSGNGTMQSINGNYQITPSSLEEVSFNIPPNSAIDISKTDLCFNKNYYSEPTAEKIIYFDNNNDPHLAYHVELRPTMIDDIYYFIDAVSGKIIHKYNNTKTDGPITGSAADLLGKTRNINLFQKGSQYYLIDASKDMYDAAGSLLPDNPKGTITILDLKNADQSQSSQYYYLTSNSPTGWAQNAVSLSYALSTAYDYYKSIHGIKSWDNSGMNIFGVINLGTNYLNAYSTGPALFFGNGDNKSYQDFTRALDIVGHEYGHSVTTYNSNLEYQSQSGALNEAYSDYSGSMVEFYTNPTGANWLIGEDAVVTTSGKIAGRDMANPANQQVMDQLPTKMSEYMTLATDQDNGGVHINCGIPSKAFYLIAQSLGREKMEKIIYRAYTKYLTQQSQFVDLRIAAIQSAADLYPGSGYEAQVGQAFDAVEIFSGNGTKPPKDIPAVTGDDYILYVGSRTKHNT